MAAKHKRIVEPFGLLVGFGAMTQENGDFSRRHAFTGFAEIVRMEEMRIVHAANPQRGVPAANDIALI